MTRDLPTTTGTGVSLPLEPSCALLDEPLLDVLAPAPIAGVTVFPNHHVNETLPKPTGTGHTPLGSAQWAISYTLPIRSGVSRRGVSGQRKDIKKGYSHPKFINHKFARTPGIEQS